MDASTSPNEPLSLLNADALILAGAVALILLLAGTAAVISWRARSRGVAIACLVVLLVLMAFLVSWASVLWLYLPTGRAPSVWSSSYLWLTFAGVIHLDRVFMIGTLAAGIVHVAIPGTHRARLLRTVGCLGVLVIASIIYAVIQLRAHGLVHQAEYQFTTLPF